MIVDYFQLALDSIRHRKLRSWLTIIGIVIGITAIVALISIGQGFQQSIMAEFEAVGFNTITALPGEFESRRGFGGSRSDSDSYLDPDLLESIEGVETVGSIRTETALINSEGLDGQAFLKVTGISRNVTSEFEEYFETFPLDQGSQLDFENPEKNQILLGQQVARDLVVNAGDSIQIEGQTFEVIGILEEVGDGGSNFSPYGSVNNGLFIPINTAYDLYGKEGRATTGLVKVEDGGDVSLIADRIETTYSAQDTPVTTVTTEEISERVNRVLSNVQLVLAGIAGISLLVGGVGVMNTMYTSVLERTREIGIMKAVGAKNSNILILFLIESGLMGLIGGVIGAGLGMGLSSIAGQFISQALPTPFAPSFAPQIIFGAVAFSFVLGALSGVFPARQAARLQPVEALRYE
ncbi:MAG: ABC transporter permease [Candidatus Acetothermia bacterium]